MSLLLRLSGTPSGENLSWCPIGRRPDSGVGPEARVFGRNAQIAALAEGRAEWVKPDPERQFAVAVVRPQGAQKLPWPATSPLSRPQLSTP
jgi:hypothetical protein